ncbi:MAG: N-methyl-L-tryptophan oxidase [Variovorax sp.]|nr:N-methyl-L-tryptophan oxidase [Variovorax sp.]
MTVSTPSNHYDAIVVGLGAVGAAALYQLAQRGGKRSTRVLGIDRFAPPHDRGSSHGESRITRLAIGEGDAYVPLVQRSHVIWRELEARTGRSIMTRTGGLILAPRDGATDHHGKPDFVRRTIASAERFGIEHQVLDAAGIRTRFPQFHLQGNEIGYFEPEFGFVRPEQAIAAQLEVARASGAEVHEGEPVIALEGGRGGGTGDQPVKVRTATATYTADRVVIAAGAWLPEFLGQAARDAWHREFEVYRQVMYWFDASEAAGDFTAGRMPIFIWMYGDGQEDYMYGFPSANAARPALKVATEQYTRTTSPEALVREVDTAEIKAMYQSRIAGRFPKIGGRAIDARACMYTVTRDRHFVIDTLPDAPRVLVVSACSGHGFKHSAGLGEAIAQRMLGESPTADLRAFAHRPASKDNQ